MNELLSAAGLALWLGILTSISPCPLATNIAAISYIGRKVEHPRLVLLAGLLYTLGRSLAYIVLSIILVRGLLSAPYISFFLQKHMMRFIGPLLILVGMVLLGLITFGGAKPGTSDRVMRRADRMGIWGAGLLGIAFALSFCPTSAALFFGGFIPISIEAGSAVGLPLVYGIGTALPAVAFAVLLVSGARYVGAAFQRITQIELWARRITGALFIATGIYISLKYIFHLL